MSKLFILLIFSGLAVKSLHNFPQATDRETTSGKVTTADFGIITCLMDGKQKSFKPRRGFFEITLDVDSKGPKDGLELLDGDAKHEGFQFEIKMKGTTKIESGGGDINCIINFYNPAGIVYTGDHVTFTISAYDKKNLTGTFSGKLVNPSFNPAKNPQNFPQHIVITEGKFDLHR